MNKSIPFKGNDRRNTVANGRINRLSPAHVKAVADAEKRMTGENDVAQKLPGEKLATEGDAESPCYQSDWHCWGSN